MPALFLDTSVLIDALRDRGSAGRLRIALAEPPAPFTCAVNIEELWRGARPGEERKIAALVESLRLAPLGRIEGERSGRWRSDFAARGVTLGQADCLIAAAAVTVGARLATANVADFPMPEVVVEDWSADR